MNIKTRRIKLKLSQAKLAKICNLSQAYICSLEGGYVQTPNQDILTRIDSKLNELIEKNKIEENTDLNL